MLPPASHWDPRRKKKNVNHPFYRKTPTMLELVRQKQRHNIVYSAGIPRVAFFKTTVF